MNIVIRNMHVSVAASLWMWFNCCNELVQRAYLHLLCIIWWQ